MTTPADEARAREVMNPNTVIGERLQEVRNALGVWLASGRTGFAVELQTESLRREIKWLEGCLEQVTP